MRAIRTHMPPLCCRSLGRRLPHSSPLSRSYVSLHQHLPWYMWPGCYPQGISRRNEAARGHFEGGKGGGGGLFEGHNPPTIVVFLRIPPSNDTLSSFDLQLQLSVAVLNSLNR